MLIKNLKYAKVTVAAAAILTSYLFLDYTLPRYDLIKPTEIGTRRFDEDGNYIRKSSSPVTGPTRDVEMIYGKASTVETDASGAEKAVVHPERDMVYINEDTGWSWPWYFKFDTADIQSDVAYHKTEGNFVWVESYGWRIEFFSWFPNVLKIVKYEPGMTVINWTRYLVLAIWLGLIGTIWYWIRRIQRNISARVEVAAQAAKERADALGDSLDAVGDRVEAFSNSEGMQTTRRRFWKIFGGWR
jgi:hypothetical protein